MDNVKVNDRILLNIVYFISAVLSNEEILLKPSRS